MKKFHQAILIRNFFPPMALYIFICMPSFTFCFLQKTFQSLNILIPDVYFISQLCYSSSNIGTNILSTFFAPLKWSNSSFGMFNWYLFPDLSSSVFVEYQSKVYNKMSTWFRLNGLIKLYQIRWFQVIVHPKRRYPWEHLYAELWMC